MNFQEAILEYAEQPITKQILLDLLKEYERPYNKMDELVMHQLLLQI